MFKVILASLKKRILKKLKEVIKLIKKKKLKKVPKMLVNNNYLTFNKKINN